MGIFNFLRKVKQNGNYDDVMDNDNVIDDNNEDNYKEIKLDLSDLEKEIEGIFEEKEENIEEEVKLTQEEIDELISRLKAQNAVVP